MKLIILDRDGVINHDSDDYIKTVDEWVPIPGSLEAIARLAHADYKIAVVTNQSGIARGYYSVATLHAMHDKFRRLLRAHGAKVNAIFYCPHGPDDQCHCRKPAAGLYDKVKMLFKTNLDHVTTVGDSFRDLESARLAGSTPVLVKTGKGLRTLAKHEAELQRMHIPVYENLLAVVEQMLCQAS